ncbi:MAG: sugar phosphate isomerase/epimerase [Litorilinea sp.]
MSDNKTRFAVFVKPWKGMTAPAMAAHVRSLGFDLIEFPVRPGFPCAPETIERDLPGVVDIFADHGIQIHNLTVALPLDDERLYAAAAAANISMNRVMFSRSDQSYWEDEQQARQALDAAVPLCEQYEVQIGVQHHSGNFLPINAMGLYHLIKDYDPQQVGAIWDPSHNALQGEDPRSGLEILQSHLCMVNLKNAYWRKVSGPEAAQAQWEAYFTSGRQGRSDWGAVADAVRLVGYAGPLTFSAEYSAHDQVDRLIVEDLAYGRDLFG